MVKRPQGEQAPKASDSSDSSDSGRRRAPATQRQRSIPQLCRELSRLLQGNWLAIAAGLFMCTLATLLKLLPAAATKVAIDNVILSSRLPTWLPTWLPIPDSPKQRLMALAALVCCVAVSGVVLGLGSSWLTNTVSRRVQGALRRRLFEHASRLPLHRVYDLRAGGAASILREDAGGVGDLLLSMVFNPWRALVQFLGGLLVLAYIDWRLLAVWTVLFAVSIATRTYVGVADEVRRGARRHQARTDSADNSGSD